MSPKDEANAIVRQVILQNNRLTGKALKKKILAASPFGGCDDRAQRIWLEAVEYHIGDRDEAKEARQPILEKWWDRPIRAERMPGKRT